MTNREFYTAIINQAVTDEVIAHATAALEKLDVARKPTEKELAKQAADAEIREQIFAQVTSEPQTAASLGEKVGVSTNKASAELRKLVAEGRVVKSDIKVVGKGTCKGYALPAVVAE